VTIRVTLDLHLSPAQARALLAAADRSNQWVSVSTTAERLREGLRVLIREATNERKK
jgi:hypothetical protein